MAVYFHAVVSLPTTDSVSVSVYVHSAATDDLVQEYLLPAMKGGSLKTLAVMLENISSVESILRELPHTKVEELAVVLMGNPDSKVVSSATAEVHVLYIHLTAIQEQVCWVFALYRLSSCANLFTQSHYSLAAATKAGLSESNTLKKFRMELVYPSFPADYILTCINNPLEELELIGFHFSCEYIHAYVCSVSVMCAYSNNGVVHCLPPPPPHTHMVLALSL